MRLIGKNEDRDQVGMACAFQTLDASRKKGKWKNKLQWDLMCRTPTWYNNAQEVGEGSYEAGLFTRKMKRIFMRPLLLRQIDGSRDLFWGEFRMGVVGNQDKAMMVDQLLLICDIAKEDWLQSNCEE